MIEIHGDAALIQLTRGCLSVIDAVDVEFARCHLWRALVTTKGVYACTSVNDRTVFLHRALTGAPKGMDVDHINGVSLDNRRQNLRVCTHRENVFNQGKPEGLASSKYVGVSRATPRTWRATISVNGKQLGLGSFCTEIEAAIARDTAAKLLRGEFARLNFPSESDVPHGEREASRKEFRNVEKFKRKLEKIASVGAWNVVS